MRTALVLLSLLLLAKCGSEPLHTTQPESPPAIEGTAGLRNFRQAFETLVDAAEVDPKNQGLAAFFNEVSGRLSSDGDPTQFSSALLMASIGLAGRVCGLLVPTQPKPASLKEAAQGYAERFWRRAADEEELAVLVAMAEAVALDAPDERSAHHVLMSLCVATASSLEALTL